MTDSNDNIEQSVSSLTSSWLNRARSGENEAWVQLVTAYRRLVCWWCGKSGIPAQDIDDLTQDVFAAVAKALPTFELKSFRGFLWTITRNKIQDYWRARNKQPVAQGGSSLHEILDNLETESSQRAGSVAQATRIVFDAVVQLVKGEFSEMNWQVFWAYAVEGKLAAEVADAHGITRNQVFLAKSRILRRIREEFGDQVPDSNR